MAEEEGGEKTHEPTSKRIQEFREKGSVPKSQDLLGVTTLAGTTSTKVFRTYQ